MPLVAPVTTITLPASLAIRALLLEELDQGEALVLLPGHLDRHEATRARLDDRPTIDDGRLVPFLGTTHRIRVVDAPPGLRISRVSRVGGDDEDELLVERAARERRETAAILEAWFRARARQLIDAAVLRHAGDLGVTPRSITIRDTTSRWGSCSRRGADQCAADTRGRRISHDSQIPTANSGIPIAMRATPSAVSALAR